MEETFFKYTNKLKPGHFLVFKDGKLEINEYHKLVYNAIRRCFMKRKIRKYLEDNRNSEYSHLLVCFDLDDYEQPDLDDKELYSIVKWGYYEN